MRSENGWDRLELQEYAMNNPRCGTRPRVPCERPSDQHAAAASAGANSARKVCCRCEREAKLNAV
eukprot:358707-Chlamydomonas_euryale.AAC.4